jgi:hypothetical protein
MKRIITQFYTFSRSFIPLRFTQSPLRPILKQPQFVFSLSQLQLGRAITQPPGRRFFMAVARVRCQVTSRPICGGQCRTGTGFLRVL